MISRIFLGKTNILIPDPKLTLIVAETVTIDYELFDKLQNVTLRYNRPECQFGILHLPTITILDYRHKVAAEATAVLNQSDFTGLASALNKPATIEIIEEKGHTYIFICDAPPGSFKKNMKYTLEIATTREGQHRTHKYVFFKSGSQPPDKIHFATLYKSG